MNCRRRFHVRSSSRFLFFALSSSAALFRVRCELRLYGSNTFA